MDSGDPHAATHVFSAGEELEKASAAMIMIHGRGASAPNLLRLADDIDQPGFAYLAPQAAGNVWYPNPFGEPRGSNEPSLGSALRKIDAVLRQAVAAGLSESRIIVLGFSQGACLAQEYAARYPRRYGGVVALSGGLIGADGELSGYPGRLDGTPIFLGCADRDPFIPSERVARSADILRELGADVKVSLFPGAAHAIVDEELEEIRAMMRAVLDA